MNMEAAINEITQELSALVNVVRGLAREAHCQSIQLINLKDNIMWIKQEIEIAKKESREVSLPPFPRLL